MSSGRDDDRTKTFVPTDARARVVVFGPTGLRTVPMPLSGCIVFGRSASCDVQIDHTSVSRRHLALHAGTPPSIEDLGSSNGTRLSGRRIEPHRLEPLGAGTLVEMGLATIVVQGQVDETSNESTAAASTTSTDPTHTPTMQRLEQLVALVARGRISVILLGETGVGKEVIAEQIHRRSARAAAPFVRLNCAAFPEHLLEGELFGYERGAFTGATQAKAGLIEAADGGSLLLDEVGELPLPTQVKLLRVIESREIQRLGAMRPRSIDVRFLAATHRDLEAMASAGTFRADLLYRLNGISITIPPLRNRRDEIPGLVSAFVLETCAQMGIDAVSVAPDAVKVLCAYAWPGNVRELRNVVERAVVLAGGGAVGAQHVVLATERPGGVADAGPRGDLRTEIESLERRRIVDALEASRGNQREAAALLGVSRRTLIGRLDAYQIARPRKGKA